eukprot:scaffold12022_cov143-Skeletonema_marinoi.AAC.2
MCSFSIKLQSYDCAISYLDSDRLSSFASSAVSDVLKKLLIHHLISGASPRRPLLFLFDVIVLNTYWTGQAYNYLRSSK